MLRHRRDVLSVVSVTVVRNGLKLTKLKMPSRRCIGRSVGLSKYERNAPEIRQWWQKLFTALEKDAAIPPDRKEEVLRDIFPEKLFRKILSILSFIRSSREEEEEETKRTDLKEPSLTLAAGAEPEECSERSGVPTLDIIDPPSEHHVVPTRQVAEHVPSDLQEVYKRRRVGQDNPYLRFFRRRLDRQRVWRPAPPLSLEEMNLTQKAEAITELIAKDFVEWMKSVGGQQDLTIENVAKMFEIGFSTHAAHSLCVKMVEMPSIPQMVAEAMEMPDRSRRACLHKLIKDDIDAAKKKPLTVAFGRSLPMEMQVKPPKDDIAKKWLYCDKVPEKLESMAAVWEGITHLRSTREFCEYLIIHPLQIPPKYLLESRMLDIAYLRRARRSIESDASGLGSVLSVPFGLGDKEKDEQPEAGENKEDASHTAP